MRHKPMQSEGSRDQEGRPADEPRRASSGQVLVMFAIFSTAMIGILGLAVDLGFAFSERRTMQNAADLSAIAGAHAVAKYTSSVPTSALANVQTVVNGNEMAGVVPTISDCTYLDDSLSIVGSCSDPVPSSATGVRVVVTETHPTYFIKVVPGGPEEVTTSAVAEARVERIFRGGTDAPFLVCGWGTTLDGGGSMDILLSNNAVNESAIGETFIVHNSVTSGSSAISRCGLSTSFRGVAENRSGQANNDGKDINEYWAARSGNPVDATREEVDGVEGCAAGVVDSYGCVLMLPVATNGANGFAAISSPRQLYTVKLLAFRVNSCGSDCHTATLLDDYSTFGGSVGGWGRDAGGVVVIKLKE